MTPMQRRLMSRPAATVVRSRYLPQVMDVISQLGDPDATRASLLDAISSLAPQEAQWWQYSASHNRFLLRLYSNDKNDYIIIGALFARQISGPTGWGKPTLELVTAMDDEFPSQTKWHVCDESAGFSLTCRQLYWGLNVGWNSDDESDWFR